MSGTAPGATTSPDAVLRWLADLLPSGRILNLGAGERAPARPSQRFVNVDLRRPRAPVARFVQGDAAALPFPDACFDGALLKDVVEHVADPLAVLRETHRVCRPGAALTLTTPRAVPRAVWDDPTHVRGFTARAITEALTVTGWEPTDRPRRIGGLPGAGRLGLEARLVDLMRIPVLGHWFGTNWLVTARRSAAP